MLCYVIVKCVWWGQTESIPSTTVVRSPSTDQHVSYATVTAELSDTAQVSPLMLSLRSDCFIYRVLCDYSASAIVAYHKQYVPPNT